ncbi:MAG: sel1 repeat family protein [Acidobacteria bacterium]|nr:sel1 repeat family protein [Acidobacteriota bacterium]
MEQDYEEAVRWSRLAAEQGDTRAQGVLGAAYYFGRAVVPDDVSAYVWLSLAATAGDESAQALRDRVAARMTRGQITEAEAQARDRSP